MSKATSNDGDTSNDNSTEMVEAYFLPDLGVSVQASSAEDAAKQAETLIAKKEGDDNL